MGFRRPASAVAMVAAALVLLPRAAEAQRLPETAIPEHYDLTFSVDIPAKRFDGVAIIRVRLPRETSRIVLNAFELTVREAIVGSGAAAQTASVALDPNAQTATLTVPTPLPAGLSEIRIQYAGVLNDKLAGFYISRGGQRSWAVTQFESTDARRAFPSFDEPAYKATFDITLRVDRDDTAISNGRVISDTPGPGPRQHTVKFATTPRMSTYLVAMAVGDIGCLEGNAESVPIRICTARDKTALGRIALDYTRQILGFYNEYFAMPYPFGKLDMVAIPDFAAGAMENTGAIFYLESNLLADSATASVDARKDIAVTIAHEVAHQWFGNLVTMQWWDDLWLNEGFATWMETRPLTKTNPEWNMDVAEAQSTETALALDSLRASRPIQSPVLTPAEIESLFDAISYQKGAAVLRMIEHYVGTEAFRAGINAYLKAHAYGNATSADFWNAITASSGKPVDQILPTFIRQPGTPVIEISPLSCTAQGQTAATVSQERFLVAQGGARTAGTTWQIPACFKTGAGSDTACTVIAQPRVAVDAGKGCSSWVFANAGARGYYRTAYAPEMLRALAPSIPTALTPAERLTLMADEWALVRANRHSAAEYLTLASAFERESSSGVLRELVDRLGFIHEYLTTDATRPAFEAFVRTLLRPALTRLGLTPGTAGAAEDDESRSLRAIVVNALGRIGRDPEIVKYARTAVDRALAGDVALDPTLKESLVHIAAENGDARLFDALTAAAGRATTPSERVLYLYATTDFRELALVDRALGRALTSDIRTQDTARYLASFFDNPAARRRAWSFVRSNWTTLDQRLRTFNAGAILARGASAFCDAATRDELRTFFSTRRLPGSSGAFNQTLERVDNCIALQERQTSAVGAWLASR